MGVEAVMNMLHLPKMEMPMVPPPVEPINWNCPVTLPRQMYEAGSWFLDGSSTTTPNESGSQWQFPPDPPMRTPQVTPHTATLASPHVCLSLHPDDADAGLHLKEASFCHLQ